MEHAAMRRLKRGKRSQQQYSVAATSSICNNNSSRSSKFRLAVLAVVLMGVLLPLFFGSGISKVPLGSVDPTEQLGESAEDPSVDQAREELRKMGMKPIYDPDRAAGTGPVDVWKAELFQRLDRIRIVCGKLCQINTLQELNKHTVKVPNAAIAMAKVEPVNCRAIMASKDIDASDSTAAAIPAELLSYFTFNHTVQVISRKLMKDIFYNGGVSRVWKVDEIRDIVARVAAGTELGTYGSNATNEVRDVIGTLPIRDKSILVIGTERPWIEAILLHFGAGKVTTLEYAPIQSEHPKLFTLLPHKFRKAYLAGTLESFDGVVTHSSVEHSGLGRYGDALNPWGDILAIARAWCVTKPGGFLYLGVPTGKDAIVSNWHRIYGPIRWPLLAANWRPMPSSGNGSELFRDTEDAGVAGGYGYKFTKPP